MDVQADAVAEAVSEKFVAGTVPRGGDDSAGGIVYGTGEFPRARASSAASWDLRTVSNAR